MIWREKFRMEKGKAVLPFIPVDKIKLQYVTSFFCLRQLKLQNVSLKVLY